MFNLCIVLTNVVMSYLHHELLFLSSNCIIAVIFLNNRTKKSPSQSLSEIKVIEELLCWQHYYILVFPNLLYRSKNILYYCYSQLAVMLSLFSPIQTVLLLSVL